MTVTELIALLQKEDGERIVVMSADAEGNGFRLLGEVATSSCKADRWEVEIGLEKLTPEDVKRGYNEEDVLEGGVPALVLWPN